MASLFIIPSLISKLFQKMIDIIVQLIVASLVLLGYLFLSLFLYVVLREIIVPEKIHLRPVHFFFHPACREWSASVPCGPSDCNYPMALVDLTPNRKPILASRQPYRVTVELDLPESPSNAAIGMFTVNMTMLSEKGRAVTTSLRPCMLHYRSALLQLVDTVARMLPLLFGSSEQKQTIEVVLFDNFIDNFNDPLVSIKITLLNCKVELYTASVKLEAELSGLTYYLYYYPVTMAMVLGLLIFVILTLCTFSIWARRCRRELQQRMGLRRQASRQSRTGSRRVGARTTQPETVQGRQPSQRSNRDSSPEAVQPDPPPSPAGQTVLRQRLSQ